MRILFALLAVVILLPGCSRSKKNRATNTPPKATIPAEKPAPREPTLAEVSHQFREVVKARIEETQVVMLLANGSRGIAPLSALSPADLAWLTKIAQDNPLPRGKSSVVVVASTEPPKKTIQISKKEGSLETVQLCPPSIIRDQIGGTCMIYARVHWLDIAGFYVDVGTIYKIINDAPSEHPWSSPRYVAGLTGIMEGYKSKTITHTPRPQDEPFAWAREELRKGRPILAALPHEIWQALPAGFVAAHPWNGGPIGHQIVINGFTWDEATQTGSFHIINSWAELMEFDLTTENAKGGLLLMEKSLSPVGEVQEAQVKEVVKKITFVKSVGVTNLYDVETNLGTRRVAAPSEDRIYSLIEQGQ